MKQDNTQKYDICLKTYHRVAGLAYCVHVKSIINCSHSSLLVSYCFSLSSRCCWEKKDFNKLWASERYVSCTVPTERPLATVFRYSSERETELDTVLSVRTVPRNVPSSVPRYDPSARIPTDGTISGCACMLLMVGCKLPAGGRAHACVLHILINKDKEELVAKNATHIETT